ncbi:hypothetical protein M440DRAFT_212814 [Trichoderma longibrachiatum ATCC 18648]|uniref:Uncharacterized protein n=1 Tax=Trichoderma longibrachiatum ATCC 18648 TaxID=983965 RepID=A0A2T4BQQ2_TRILO|nr:hypothetical protein M440DRAFT_212814 [Trichoderma longibrachiatum ATCC 18648]
MDAPLRRPPCCSYCDDDRLQADASSRHLSAQHHHHHEKYARLWPHPRPPCLALPDGRSLAAGALAHDLLAEQGYSSSTSLSLCLFFFPFLLRFLLWSRCCAGDVARWYPIYGASTTPLVQYLGQKLLSLFLETEQRQSKTRLGQPERENRFPSVRSR